MADLGMLERPIEASELEDRPADGARPGSEWLPVVPVPNDAPRSFPDHSLGRPAKRWPYRDASGRLVGLVCRFDKPDGQKAILPLTFAQSAAGKRGWRWQALPEPRPLYGLELLASKPDARVLVVEGEKTADAARALFSDHVVMTWCGGAAAVHKADWGPLEGRSVVLWPDADEPGRAAMAAVAETLSPQGCDVRLVAVPDDWPSGWDLADTAPPGVTPDALRAMLDGAVQQLVLPKIALPTGFRMNADGLWCVAGDNPLWLSDPFEVLAETRNVAGSNWGVFLRWHDRDGRMHQHAIPRELLAGDGADVRRLLLDRGLTVATGPRARQRFLEFVLNVRTEKRARAVDRVGWADDAFVLPDSTIGSGAHEHVIYQQPGGLDSGFTVSGSLDGWQQDVARYAIGNSLLATAMCAAFAAPLLSLLDEEGGGFHFRGGSSVGKTTALGVAASVWGAPSSVRTWRATSNGLEGVAAAHNDALLCLDELGQANGREAGEVAYMLANGVGKSRARATGDARPSRSWRVLYLSTGEVGVAHKVNEDGRSGRFMAGQAVRTIELEADAGAGHGLFETLHDFASGDALSRHLKQAAASHYGYPVRKYLQELVRQREKAITALRATIKDFVDGHVPDGSDGQVRRAAGRFALLAAAGELAIAFGVLRWPEGEATRAVASCFRDWIEQRGGVGAAEVQAAKAALRSFIHTHGASRFQSAEGGERVNNRAGVRDGDVYYLTADAWREAMPGLDPIRMARELAADGVLAKGNDGRATVQKKFASWGANARFYAVRIGGPIDDD